MDVSEIVDRESFKAWLEALPEEGRFKTAIMLAARAVVRVFPFWAANMAEALTENRIDLTVVPVARNALIGGVAVTALTPQIRSAAAAARKATVGAPQGIKFSELGEVAVSAAADIAEAVSQTNAEWALGSAQYAACYAGCPEPFSAMWSDLQRDIRALAKHSDIRTLPLWPGDMPPEIADAWTKGREWMEDAPGHAFWIRWYEAILAGKPLTQDWDSHWQLMHDIALIPDEDWGEGKEQDAIRVAGLIEGLCAPYALNMTQSNEAVEKNPETGLLRLVPVTPLEEGFHRYIRRKLSKALRLFGDHPNSGNVYTAILPELALLRDAIEDAENLPVELYDACTSITTRVAARIEEGSLPPEDTDALIADFLKRVREAGAEIFSEDEETQKALARRNKLAPNDALLNEREAVQKVAEVIAEHSEPGPLARMGETAAEVLNPAASAEKLQAVLFKLAARLLRGMGALGWSYLDSTVKTAGKATGTALVGAVVDAATLQITTPYFQATYRAILQFLGLA